MLGITGQPLTGFNQGSQTVTTAGTRVQLNTASVPCRVVLITGKLANTGYIYVGDVNVSSTAYGKRLLAGDSITIPIGNLNLVYLDASVNGEGVDYLYAA